MSDHFAHKPHPKDALIIDDLPNTVVDEEGFEVARFRSYNDAASYVEIVNENHPCACYSIEGEDPDKPVKREHPDLLTPDEEKELLATAERVWRELQANNLGGYSGGNRPFWILAEFKAVIEKFGHRDIGQTWTRTELDAARKRRLHDER